jgi:hypothetical protein
MLDGDAVGEGGRTLPLPLILFVPFVAFFFHAHLVGMIRVPCDARMQKHTAQIEAMTSQI